MDFEQVEDDFALPARGQAAAAQRLVDRSDAAHFEKTGFGVVAGVGQQLELGLNHFEIAGGTRGLDLAVEGHGLSGVEFAVEVGSVEPDALEREASLADGEFEDGHAAGAQQSRAAHLGDDAGSLAGLQFVEAAGILAVLIAKGQMVEQVFGGLNVFGGEHFRHARTHAAHVHDWGIESGHTLDANSFVRRVYGLYSRAPPASELRYREASGADFGRQHAQYAERQLGLVEHQKGKIFAADEAQFSPFEGFGSQRVGLISDQCGHTEQRARANRNRHDHVSSRRGHGEPGSPVAENVETGGGLPLRKEDAVFFTENRFGPGFQRLNQLTIGNKGRRVEFHSISPGANEKRSRSSHVQRRDN